MSSSAILLVNPAAGSFRPSHVERIARLLKERGFTQETIFSQERGGIQRLAGEVKNLSPEIVLVLGGDGTFNEAANGLVHSGIPVIFVPLGTTNVLAQELDIPRNIEKAVERALKSSVQTISLGKVVLPDGQVRYFIMMAGIGFDAYSVYRTNQAVKRLLGKGSYIWSGLKVVMGYDPSPVEIISEGSVMTGYAVIVGNGSRYGGKFRVAPDASLFEPSLYTFVLRSGTRAALLRAVYRIIRSRHIGTRDVEYFRTEKLSLRGNAHVQVDGDYLGRLPVDISVEPRCLKILF